MVVLLLSAALLALAWVWTTPRVYDTVATSRHREQWRIRNSHPGGKASVTRWVHDWARSRGALRRHRAIDYGALSMEVATRLRAGADAGSAWGTTLHRIGVIESEHVFLDERGVPEVLSRLLDENTDPRSGVGIRSCIAACRLSYTTGSPTADILDTCATGISEMNEASDALTAALAGPRMSARTVALLPVAGIGLGTFMGADPVDYLTHTPGGVACLVAGLLCEGAGILWSRSSVAAARRSW